MYEHICLKNIKKLYKTAGKSDDKQQYKAILWEALDDTPEVFNDKCSEKLHLQSYLEMLWSKTGYFGL